MKYTCSFHNGIKFNQNHNTNKEFRNKEPHINQEKEIIVLHNEPIKEFYNRFFKESLEEYNSKQTRSDRVIKDYYTHINKGSDEKNGKKPVYEVIVQVGNLQNHPSEVESIAILKDFFENFKEKNKNLECISAAIHLDEKTPHMHLDYVPISYQNKRGLSVQNSLVKALNEMGYVTDKYHDTAQIKWQKAQMEELIKVCEKHNLEIENPKNIGQKHLEKEDFIISQVEKKIALLKEYEAKINYQTAYINEQEITIKNGNELIAEQDKSINQKEEEIKQKEERLNTQNETINKNHNILINQKKNYEKTKKELQEAQEEKEEIKVLNEQDKEFNLFLQNQILELEEDLKDLIKQVDLQSQKDNMLKAFCDELDSRKDINRAEFFDNVVKRFDKLSEPKKEIQEERTKYKERHQGISL